MVALTATEIRASLCVDKRAPLRLHTSTRVKLRDSGALRDFHKWWVSFVLCVRELVVHVRGRFSQWMSLWGESTWTLGFVAVV